jgi:outer membrane protein OmpA-like peptidoglycan-associated protein
MMQLRSSALTTSAIALCVTSLAIGLPRLSLAACASYQTQVNSAVQARNLDELVPLLATLKNQPDCPANYLDWLEHSMSQIAAAEADSLTQQGRLNAARQMLEHAPTILWTTQVVRGDIAAREKKWIMASQYYNQTLDLIADPETTPNAPPEAVIQKIFRLASQAQVLAGSLNNTIDRSGEAKGVMRTQVRGFKPKKRLIPVLFGFGRYRLSDKGEKAAQLLAEYLKKHQFDSVTLIGHTDSKGSHQVNDWISKKRADFLKRYLEDSGVTASIETVGKGKRQPLELDNPESYTQAEIDLLNRRVEFEAR